MKCWGTEMDGPPSQRFQASHRSSRGVCMHSWVLTGWAQKINRGNEIPRLRVRTRQSVSMNHFALESRNCAKIGDATIKDLFAISKYLEGKYKGFGSWQKKAEQLKSNNKKDCESQYINKMRESVAIFGSRHNAIRVRVTSEILILPTSQSKWSKTDGPKGGEEMMAKCYRKTEASGKKIKHGRKKPLKFGVNLDKWENLNTQNKHNWMGDHLFPLVPNNWMTS